MKFGQWPLDRAEGLVLAHSMAVAGGRLAKGAVLGAADVAALRAAGHQAVAAAMLEPGDLPEDEAALRLARALVPDEAALGLRLSGAGAGRVNLHSLGPGLCRVDAAAVAALNSVDPMVTLATLPDYAPLGAGGMVATIKIISYAVPETVLDRACAGPGVAGALRVMGPVMRRACLIETSLGTEAPPEKGRRVTAARLAAFGVELTPRVVVPHEEAALAQAISAAVSGDGAGTGDGTGDEAGAGVDMVLVLTASATSDMGDVAPEALRRAGGRVERFGMPVDPGNLLFLGDISGCPVVGLPGCARSPALNGADWVLGRLICGIPVGAADIAAMGVGGLLKEIPTRPRPRHRRGA